MAHWKTRLPVFAAALWWGSLTAIGFVAVPLLFQHLPTAAEAGRMAARLFTAQAWLSLVCGLLLVMAARTDEDPPRMDWAGGAIAFVVTGMLLALLLEFGVAPHIRARTDPAFWHTAGTAMYAVQWLCALAVLWKVAGRQPGAGRADAASD